MLLRTGEPGLENIQVDMITFLLHKLTLGLEQVIEYMEMVLQT
jgi:hypothetical protein